MLRDWANYMAPAHTMRVRPCSLRKILLWILLWILYLTKVANVSTHSMASALTGSESV
jgi:hypothetical protein